LRGLRTVTCTEGWTAWPLQSSNSWHYSRVISRVPTPLFIAVCRSLSVPPASHNSVRFIRPVQTLHSCLLSFEIDRETN
jgi:surface polysaccharide O-acyltransferase-like enzyme